jgi:hypothetical protein
MYRTPIPKSKKTNLISTKGKKKLTMFRKVIGFCKIHNKREYITGPKTETLSRVNIFNTGNQLVNNITDSGFVE